MTVRRSRPTLLELEDAAEDGLLAWWEWPVLFAWQHPITMSFVLILFIATVFL